MPTLRRILKYTPAVVIGLLIVLWVIGVTWPARILLADKYLLVNERGSIGVGTQYNLRRHDFQWVKPFEYGKLSHQPNSKWFGDYRSEGWMLLDYPSSFGWVARVIPLHLVLAALAPVALGAATGFRFRLWHYLAYTALVAVELAYYLRWQE